LGASAEQIGVDVSDYVVGDIADPDATASALDGCDAVIHCAAMVSTDPDRADEMLHTNLEGARNVLGGAAAAKLDRSSTSRALPRCSARVWRSCTRTCRLSAGRTGTASPKRWSKPTREDAGAPVDITYPGMVLGPPAGDQFGEAAEGVEAAVKMRGVPGRGAAWIVVDVRDLAAIHSALLQPGYGPRRYVAGGQRIPVDRIASLVGSAVGRRLSVYPVPDVALRALGQLFDVIGDQLPFETPINSAAMQYYTQMPPSDDGPSERDLGVTQRDPAETIADTAEGLQRVGRI
jgi:nucleoside-diphosphate-sugar epimerase